MNLAKFKDILQSNAALLHYGNNIARSHFGSRPSDPGFWTMAYTPPEEKMEQYEDELLCEKLEKEQCQAKAARLDAALKALQDNAPAVADVRAQHSVPAGLAKCFACVAVVMGKADSVDAEWAEVREVFKGSELLKNLKAASDTAKGTAWDATHHTGASRWHRVGPSPPAAWNQVWTAMEAEEMQREGLTKQSGVCVLMLDWLQAVQGRD